MVTLEFAILILPSLLGSNGFHDVPLLGDQPFLIKAEDVEGDLFAHTGEVVNGLQEDLVAIFECTDVVDSGLHRSRSEIGNTAHKGITTGAVSEIVLDVTLCKQRSGFFGVQVR